MVKGRMLNLEVNLIANQQCEVSVTDPRDSANPLMQKIYELQEGHQNFKDQVDGLNIDINMNENKDNSQLVKEENTKKYVDLDINVKGEVCTVRMVD